MNCKGNCMHPTNLLSNIFLQGAPFLSFQQFTEKSLKKIKERLAQEKQRKEEERDFVFCKFCNNKITTINDIIDVNGHYQHTFTNPAGVTYLVGCFSSAIGCVNRGKSTFEHTWFNGYSWKFALCSKCQAHLGWFYTPDEEGISFFGLILDNLS